MRPLWGPVAKNVSENDCWICKSAYDCKLTLTIFSIVPLSIIFMAFSSRGICSWCFSKWMLTREISNYFVISFKHITKGCFISLDVFVNILYMPSAHQQWLWHLFAQGSIFLHLIATISAFSDTDSIFPLNFSFLHSSSFFFFFDIL